MSASRLAARLALARQRRFVAREAERDIFQRALTAPDPPLCAYRRHLKAGVIRLTEILWQWELDAGEA